MQLIKRLTQTLSAGSTSLTFTDSLINDNSIIEVYADSIEVYPTALSQTGTSVTVTFDAQTAAHSILLLINNIVSLSDPELATLLDVDLSTLSEDDILTYDETAEKWVNAGARTAEDIAYDNTDSGLTATNVQDAIDELEQSGGGTSELTSEYWSNSTAYAVGSIVIYLNALYRCKVANTGQTPTNTTYWDAISLTDIAQPKSVPLTDFVTMNSGFSIVESRVFKQGYRVFGDICVKSTSAYTSTSSSVGTINEGYRPTGPMLPLCLLGYDEWSQRTVGYCYLNANGAFLFADQVSSQNKAAKVHIDYMTA